MKVAIPYSFYIRYWLKNSVMAIATGFLLGFLMGMPLVRVFPFLILIVPPLSFPIFAVVIYQVVIFSHFWGYNRGNFEYAYRERLIEKSANKLVIKVLGIRKFVSLFLEELSEMSIVRDDLYQELLVNSEVEGNDEYRFLVYMKIAKSAVKESNHDKEIEYLRKAVSIKPNDLIANYRLGHSLERAGNGNKAIASYETALREAHVGTNQLEEFIVAQIDRIKLQGPTKKPPMPGLRYMTW